MTNDVQDPGSWPLPTFHFSVDIGDWQGLVFQEVTGLETASQVIEYRAADSKPFSTVKMPGIGKLGNVILKKGMVPNDDRFSAWFPQIKMNTIERVPVVIKLLDEKGNTTMMWTLKNAFPVKVTGADLKADGNEVAVDALELAHEGVTVQNG